MTDSKDNVIKCWNSIGVWGRETPRCPVLKEVIHCRNCQKFVEAGHQALNRPLPEQYMKEWTTQLATVKKEKSRNTQQSLLVFRLGKEWLGIRCAYLNEICESKKIRSIPNVNSPLVKGLVNISGKVQLCFSLGQLIGFGKYKVAKQERNRLYETLLVFSWDERDYVFPVSEIEGIVAYEPAAMLKVPDTFAESQQKFLLGIMTMGNRDVGCLDAEAVFNALDRSVD